MPEATNRKKIGLVSAVFIGISSMIGSGWLFASLVTAKIAGGGAILAWIIAAVMVWLLFMAFSEIAGLYPKRGLSAVIPTISHNKYYGFPFALANWLGIVAVIALEATASIEYLIQIFPHYEPIFFTDHHLTTYGSLLGVAIIMLYCILNYWGLKILAKANNTIVVFKLVIPLVTAVLLLVTAFHAGNFTPANENFFKGGFDGVVSAVLLGGLIVAFNGGQTIISYASEIKNPQRTIPLSITIAIVFTLFIYLLLQISFIGAIPPDMLEKGWSHLNFNAPMVQLTGLVGLHFMMIVLYVDAMVSPMGTAITYVGASTRMTTAMARKKQMPAFFSNIDKHVGVSRRSLFFNIGLSILFLFSFTNWADLAQMLGLIHILSYLAIPIALVVFRREVPRNEYSFRLPFGTIVSWFLFVFFCYLYSMASISVAFRMFLVLLTFQIIFIFINVSVDKSQLKEGITKSIPLFSFLVIMLFFNYHSPNGNSPIPYLSGTERFGDLGFIALLTLFTSIVFFFFVRHHVSDMIVEELEIARNEN